MESDEGEDSEQEGEEERCGAPRLEGHVGCNFLTRFLGFVDWKTEDAFVRCRTAMALMLWLSSSCSASSKSLRRHRLFATFSRIRCRPFFCVVIGRITIRAKDGDHAQPGKT